MNLRAARNLQFDRRSSCSDDPPGPMHHVNGDNPQMIKRITMILAAAIVSGIAYADDAAVPLTQSELQLLLNSQSASAIASVEQQRARAVLEKLQRGFAPKPPESPPTTQEDTPVR